MERKCIGIYTNPNKEDAVRALGKAIELLTNNGYDCAVPEIEIPALDNSIKENTKIFAIENKKIELLVVLGGDGTVMRAINISLEYDVPILGINFGRVGFLCEVEFENLIDAVNAAVSGECSIDRKMLIDGYLNGEKQYTCLNDCIVYKRVFSGVADVDVYIDEMDVGRIMCDGIIISTPTGSTAYSISAGGPIIADGLDIMLVTPIFSHSLCIKPIVAKDSSTIKVVTNNDTVSSFDGLKNIELKKGDIMEFKRSERQATFISFKKRNIFSLLREKLK